MELTKTDKAAIADWRKGLPKYPNWIIDDVLFYNHGIELSYNKNLEDGHYVELTKEGKLTIGTYQIGFPHISDALFTPLLILEMPMADAKNLSFKLLRSRYDQSEGV